MPPAGTADVPGLTQLGRTAREFETVPFGARRAVAAAEEALYGGLAGSVRTASAMSRYAETWSSRLNQAAGAFRSVGDKLVATANAYQEGDAAGEDEFARVPLSGGVLRRPI